MSSASIDEPAVASCSGLQRRRDDSDCSSIIILSEKGSNASSSFSSVSSTSLALLSVDSSFAGEDDEVERQEEKAEVLPFTICTCEFALEPWRRYRPSYVYTSKREFVSKPGPVLPLTEDLVLLSKYRREFLRQTMCSRDCGNMTEIYDPKELGIQLIEIEVQEPLYYVRYSSRFSDQIVEMVDENGYTHLPDWRVETFLCGLITREVDGLPRRRRIPLGWCCEAYPFLKEFYRPDRWIEAHIVESAEEKLKRWLYSAVLNTRETLVDWIIDFRVGHDVHTD